MNQPKIAVIHAQQTRFEARKDQQSYAELVYDPVRRLLDETGLWFDDVDTVITCSSDFLDGRTISDMAVQEATGSIGKSCSKVSNDGAFSLIYAWMRLLAGEYETCLVTAHSKCSEGNQPLIENAAFDPLLLRRLGLTHLTASALQARALLEKNKFTAEQFALAAVHDLRRAASNPHAHHGGNYSVKEVLAEPFICDPIHPLEAAPYSDGAACLLIATETWLKNRGWKKPVTWIKGLGYCTENHYLGDRNLTENVALRQASQKAYLSAGISSPCKQIDSLEISAGFSYQIPLWLEEMGMLDGVRLEDYLHADNSSDVASGSLPALNPSGGLMGANPGFASGLVRIVEATTRIREKPGAIALAHGTNGLPAQAHCVWAFESGEVQ